MNQEGIAAFKGGIEGALESDDKVNAVMRFVNVENGGVLFSDLGLEERVKEIISEVLLNGERRTSMFREQLFIDVSLVSKEYVFDDAGNPKVHYKLFLDMFTKMLSEQLANHLAEAVTSRKFYHIHASGKVMLDTNTTPNYMLNSYFLSTALTNFKLPNSEFTHKELMAKIKNETMVLYFAGLNTAKKTFSPEFSAFNIKSDLANKSAWEFSIDKGDYNKLICKPQISKDIIYAGELGGPGFKGFHPRKNKQYVTKHKSQYDDYLHE